MWIMEGFLPVCDSKSSLNVFPRGHGMSEVCMWFSPGSFLVVSVL